VTARLIGAGLAAALALAATSGHALDFKDGRWRVIIETQTRGMAVKIPPKYQYEHCLTKRDFKPDFTPLHASCRTMDTVMEDDEITWKFACRERGANVHGHGNLRFSGTRFSGALNTVSEYPERLEVVQKLTGRYLGECRAADRRAPERKPAPKLRPYEETK
jgi:hypothetical protein